MDTGWLAFLLGHDRAPFCACCRGGWTEKEVPEEGRLPGKESVWARQAENTLKSRPQRRLRTCPGQGRGHRPLKQGGGSRSLAGSRHQK